MQIRNVRLVDGLADGAVDDVTVECHDGRITAIRPASADAGGDDDVIDGSGKTLLPGLINCHVHFGMDGSPDPHAKAPSESVAEEAYTAVRSALATLAGGVTTVRDCGGHSNAVPELSRRIEAGQLMGPRILSCGSIITMTGGHGHWGGYEADGPEGLRAAVRHQVKHGARWIKLAVTGGVLTPGTELGAASFTQAELDAAVAEATNLGRYVCTHAIGTTGIKNAIRAGVRSIEHGSYLDDEAVAMMLERGVAHVPTLSAYYQVVSHGDAGTIPESAVAKATSAHESNTASFRKSLDAGVLLAAGTDAGTPYNVHGGIGLELRLMVEAGATPLQAIQIATRNAARMLGVDELVGTVEVGKQADLIAVDGDPLTDIGLLAEPALVIKNGTVVLRRGPERNATCWHLP